MKYGVFDSQDKCWMGDKSGPLLYEDQQLNGKPCPGETLARYAATIMAHQFKSPLGRFKATPYDGTGNEHKDEVETKRSLSLAMSRAERGRSPL